MKCLVTGGAGFIGSNLVDLLIKKKHDVFVIDNLTTGKLSNINNKSKFIKLDILNKKKIINFFKKNKFDFVFHLAAQINVRDSLENPSLDANVNILGTLNILEGCKINNSKLIYSSTGGALYGFPEYLPCNEKHKINPTSFYGLSKYTSEKYIQLYSKLSGLDYVILRYSNVYGPRQDPKGEAGVISIFINRLIKNKTCFINGNGKQTRDFIYVGDIINANLEAMNANKKIFNVGTGNEISINELYKSISVYLKISKKPDYKKEIPGEVKNSSIDYSHIKNLLGWSPSININEGLKKTIDFFKNN